MKSNFKVDPSITFDHMHSEEQNTSGAHSKINTHALSFVIELITIGALLGFMILMMN